jgi:hypothetical protein
MTNGSTVREESGNRIKSYNLPSLFRSTFLLLLFYVIGKEETAVSIGYRLQEREVGVRVPVGSRMFST